MLVSGVECAERARSSRLRVSESGEVGFGDGTCGMTEILVKEALVGWREVECEDQ